MGIISGQDSALQIGLETDWGSGVAPTVQLPFTSESIKLVKTYIKEDALLGHKTSGNMYTAGEKVEGDITVEVKPDTIGLLLACALGGETAPAAAEATSTVYDHAFSLLAGGSSNSLPKLTVVVDRKAAVFGYVSCKVNQMVLEATVSELLKATFSLRGRNEQSDTLESLSNSTKQPFRFSHGALNIDDAAFADVTSFKITVNNNLEDNFFTMDSSAYMQEIEPQGREVTIELEANYSTANDAIRSSNYKEGASVDVDLTFTSGETAGASLAYRIVITCPLAFITACDPVISGPERIKLPMTLIATENDSYEPLTITLRDLQGTAYLA
jgi:hypothetical protein